MLACRSDEEGLIGEPTTGPVKRGGIFHMGSTTSATSIDPHTEVTMGLTYICFIYGYLLHQVQEESGPTLYYDHAVSLEQPEELTYLFKMRSGVRFQNLPPVNGREVTAQDVEYTFKRIAANQATPFWTKKILEMAAIDDSSFRVRIDSPYAYTMGEFGGIRTAIVPHEAVEQWGDLRANGVGSGPFQIGKFSRNSGIEMVKNPEYYVEGIPYVDGITNQTIPDDSSLMAAFKAKQLDVYGPPSKIQAENVASFSPHVLVSKNPSLSIFMINLNEIAAPVLQDQRVREALDIALDRDAMIEKLAFGDGNYTGPVSWGLEFWSLPQDELRQRFRRDVGKARQLLEAANQSDLKLQLKFPSGPTSDLAAMMKEHWQEAGIEIEMLPMELGTWISDLYSQKFELMVGGGLPYGDENLPLQFNHTNNWTRVQAPVRLPEPEIDALLDRLPVTPDIDKRQKLALEVTRKILDRHGPFLYLYAPYGYTAVWDHLHGYEDVNPQLLAYTYNMWLDK